VLLVTKGLDIGGIERIVVDLAIALHRRGVPVEVAVVNDDRSGFSSLLGAAGVVVHGLGGSDHIGWAAARRLARLVREPRFTVVHVHGPLPSVIARLARGHRPVVTTSHTPLSALRLPTRLAWLLTAGRDAESIAVSAMVAASMPRRVARRMSVLPHGVDPAAIAAAAAAAPPHLADATVRVVTVASHRGAKNYPNLLRAVKAACDLGAVLHLTAVGTGPELQRHIDLAAELGLADVVTFFEPTTDVLHVIAGADLLVVASDYEGQPLVVLEALALGKPVVATAVGRVPELVSPAVGRVVPPGDAEALGAALAEVAGDAALRARMGLAARHEGHTWTLDDVVAAHLALYAKVGAE
jgi:glycosyltransferase involved in cell wall biosynthesis